MATLIQSKQIQGIVTASVITGEFLVSGSLVVTGSNSILGSVTASAISSSFVGDGSGITGITYSQIGNTPQFVGGNNITITSSSNVITVHAQLDGTGSDSQNLSISGDQLTILGGNTITIPTGSNVSDYFELSNIPQGIVSSSVQVLGGSGVLSGSKTDISSLNTFSASIQSEVDSLTAATSSYITSIPQGTISGSEQLPQGLVSGSSQITITESQISDLTHYTDSNVKTKLDTEGVLSGSLVSQLPSGVISGSEQLPSGLISGSSQITITQSQISDLTHTSVDSLNTFSASIQSEVDSLTSATSSYLTTIPSGTISGSEQLPQGLISGSSQITITESQISDLSHYTNTDVQSYIDSIGVVSGSVVAELPSGVISGSSQLPVGLISGSQQVIDSLPSGIVSGSDQITISSSQISDLAHTQIPAGTISGSEQLPSGLVSGSTQVVDSLPSGVISGSSQITITESQISDLSHRDISSLNTFTSSIQSEVDSLTASTSSYLTSIDSGIVSSSTQVTELLPSGVISGSSQLPSGLVSGSTQITDGSGIVSSSAQVISHLPQGTVSGSAQTISNLPSGVVSGSFSSSMSTAVELLNEVSGANYIESQSADSRLNIIEGSVGMYYDLSNTVWNQMYIKSGSDQAALTSDFQQSGRVPFRFKLNEDRKLNYNNGDIVYINNFDRDTTITAFVSSPYDTGSREVGFKVVSVNQQTGSYRINDSYWVISRHTAGFVDSASYTDSSASFDERIGVIVASGSGADWNVNLYNKPSGIVSSSQQQYTASIQNGFALTSSLDNVSSSLATTISNVYASSSNFDARTLVSGSSQIDLRNVTNYVADEHIDHTTVLINAGDGLDGGGDISNSRTLTLNVTSSHFEGGVTDILTSEGVVKQSTLDTDLVGTDFSQSVDNRINAISAGAVPSGTVSGSTQIDITQTQNYTSFSSSIASDINSLSVGTTDISHLNTFTSSADTRITNLENFSSSLDTSFATDTELTNLSASIATEIDNIVHTQIPSGTISGSAQITALGFVSESGDNLPQGTVSGSSQLTSSYDTRYALSGSSGTSDFTELTNVPSGLVSGSEQITISDTNGYTTFSSSLSASIHEASLSGDSIDTSTFATTGSNTFRGSQFITGSIIPEATAAGNGIHDLGSESNPFGELYVTTGSVSFVKDGSVVSKVSGEQNAIRVGDILITTASIQQPIGLISGSIVGSGSVSVTSGSGVITISSTGGGVSSWTELSGIPSGLVSSSEQIASDISGAFYAPSASIASDIASLGGGTYDGNRIISNEDLGDLFTNQVNVGTSGSLVDFINAVFFPNTAASFTNANFTIEEWSGSGDIVGTLTATDPEGQSVTFAAASSYTDGYVAIASNGVVTLTRTADSASFNTTFSGSGHGHEFTAEVTDTFGTSTTKDFYLFVTPNTAPVFRETSVAGNVITSVTANLNENSTDNTLVKRVYFTDVDGDSITIYSSSIDNNHFDIEKFSTYVDIRQNTSSLDYEQQTTYTFSISASDEHYESGDDSDSITSLLITVNVTDNLTPTLNNQTLSSINENSSNGATVGSISAADNEGDTITFKNFELHQLQLDGSTVSSGSYSGTSQLTDPTENPFQMNSSGVVTRKTGVYINSDLINKYIYRAQVTDSYNGDSDVALITINITDDTPATLSDNWSAGPYIKESETSGTTIKTTNYGSTTADYGSNQSGTWSSSNSAISINSNGNLSLGVDLSGSVTQSGDTLDSTITFTNTFGTTTTDSLSLTIVANSAPTATFSNQSSVFNSNEATNGTNLVSVSISDTESDTPYQLSIGGTDASKLNAVPQNAASSSWELQASEDLSGGTYTYDITVTDNYSKSTTYSSRTITIAQGDTGTLGGDTTSYIIESAESGDSLRDATGYNQGNTSQLSVSYTNYGSPTVQSYTSSNEAFNIDTSGNITLGLDISGSSTGSGDTISSDITFVDQFGNIGSGSLTVNVFANGAATATFTDNSSFFNTNQATGSVSLVDVSVTDTEGDTPYVLTLGGTNGSSLSAVSQNVNGTSWEIQPASDLSDGTYTYDVTVTDNFGKSTTYSGRTIAIAAADTGDLVSTDAYIIESAVSGDLIRRNDDGTSGTQSSVAVSYSPSYGSPVATNFASSNALIDIDSAGRLSVGNDISGSGSTNGSLIATTISWNDQYGNNGSEAISVEVTQNFAPTVSSTQTFNENTNQARGTSEIVRLNLTDTEGDTIPNSSLSFINYNTTYFTPSISTPQMKLLANSTNIPAGTYDYTASIEDVHGFDTTVHSGSVTIAQADNGTLIGDTAIYIIESAVSGAVFRDQTGFNQGNAAQVSVSYSPSYGSPVVTEFTSSRQGISVDSSGNLTAGYDFSGSVTSTDYTSTALVSDSTNSTLYGKSLHVNGIKVVQGAATGSQSAVPDAFTEKVAQTIKLMVTSSGADINYTDQANMIGILKGETGTWHSGYPTAQRILRGAGSDYSPNPLIDSNYSSYPGLQNFQDSHATDDMIWYLNSSATSGSGDDDIVEVIEHLMHTIHQYGVRGAVSGSYNALSWDPDTDSDWNTRELYLAIKEAVDNSVFDISDYGDASYNTASTFKLLAKEYLYLLNFNMWEYSSLWDGGSLSPEWNDNSRTPSGIQTNNPLGYALYNKYIKPVLTKPSKTVLQNIFQDGDVGDPTVAGSSGYTPEVGTGLISKITFRDQYDNIGSGSVTATIFGNSSPAASFTATSDYDTDASVSGSTAGTLTVTDTENNSPFTITLAGTDGGKFDVSGSSSPFTIQPTGSLDAGTYSINITVTDSYSESVTLTNETIVVDAAEVLTEGYIYYSAFGSDAGLAANYLGLMGGATVNSDTPPEVTSYTANTASPFYKFKAGDVGSSSITYAGGATATLGGTISGSNFNDAIRSAGNMSWGTGVQTIFVIPSGSTMTGIPTSMTDGTGGSTTGEYVLVEYADGTTAPLGATPSTIHSIVLDSAVDGYTEWFIIGATQQNSATNMRLQVISSSGSIADF